MTRPSDRTNEELDAAAAEEVMGCDARDHASGFSNGDESPVVQCGYWSPSTDWRAAGELLEAMRERGWYCEVTTKAGYGWDAAFVGDPEGDDVHTANADTAPRAIAAAALQAKRAEREADR